MNILDAIIIVAAIAYGISGFRNGAVVGLFSMIGFFGGAVAGAQLAEPLGSRVADGRAQIPVAIICVLFAAMIGQLIGVWAAGHVRTHIVKDGSVQKVDSSVGSALGVVSVLLVAWMVAVPLASSPYPSLSSAAVHSRIVRGVNDVMPKDVRSLYSSMRSFLNQSGFPPVFGDLPQTRIVKVAPPDATLSPAFAAQVTKARASIFKIYGDAPSCNRGIEGSGFVYERHRMITNAHVVAGTSRVGVRVDGQTLPATVVTYDPERDIAVLAVPGLNAPPLRFSPAPAASGAPAVVLGYPADGPFTIRSARVRSRDTVSGKDIYGNGNVRRNIYSVYAVVR
ncbi:MAG: MarP family serine protease, partial [Jatrophihabitantaceae bacterium]